MEVERQNQLASALADYAERERALKGVSLTLKRSQSVCKS